MSRRPSLAGLVADAAPIEHDTHQSGTPASRPAPVPAAVSPARPAPPPGRAAPRYLDFIRKEARLSGDQLNELNAITRRLNTRRQGSGERITDNTLIRVAVDLLLRQQDRLGGHTEAELRESVGL